MARGKVSGESADSPDLSLLADEISTNISCTCPPASPRIEVIPKFNVRKCRPTQYMSIGWMLDYLVETSINCSALYARAAKPLVSLRICKVSSEPLVVYADDTEIVCNS